MASRSPRYLFWQRVFMHPAQALAAYLIMGIVRLLPLDAASAAGGWVGRRIGPRLGLNKRARNNLRRAYPQITDAELEILLGDMWENMGRTAFEYPHIGHLDIYGDTDRFEIVNRQIADQLIEDGGPVVFVAAHLANWELMPLTVTQRGMDLSVVYRAPDNPWVNRLFLKRAANIGANMLPKGRGAAKGAMATLRAKNALGMLVDQKMNDGIAVPFFGQDAMTAPAAAQFALKFNCPIIPVRIERTVGAKFRITFYPALDLPTEGDNTAKILSVMGEINQQIEEWIRARPDQWLWPHNRWPR